MWPHGEREEQLEKQVRLFVFTDCRVDYLAM